MKVFVLDHSEGCTPLHPCSACLVFGHLRASLTPEALAEYVRLVEEASIELPDPASVSKDPQLRKLVVDEFRVEGRIFGTRIQNSLRQARIRTIGDLVVCSAAVLVKRKLSGYLIGVLKKNLADRDLSLAPN